MIWIKYDLHYDSRNSEFLVGFYYQNVNVDVIVKVKNQTLELDLSSIVITDLYNFLKKIKYSVRKDNSADFAKYLLTGIYRKLNVEKAAKKILKEVKDEK